MNTTTLTQTTSTPQTLTANDLYKDVVAMEKAFNALKKKLAVLLMEPKYGSDEWWEKSDREALEQYKKGRYTTLHNEEELKKFLGL